MKASKTIIGVDSHKENEYITSVNAKISRFTALLDYCNQFISIDDIKAFSEAPNEYFKKAFNEKYESDFPPLVNYAKRLELCNISQSKIYELESNYKAIQIENFDPVKLEAPKKDFNIYAIDSEAVKRYEKTKQLCDLLNDLRNEFQVYPANVIQGVTGAIQFSFQTNQFDINVNFINQIKSRTY
jgi:hypothetical protein